MAQSDDVTGDGDREFQRETLPGGDARLVLRENDVTITFEGDEDRVHQRLLEHLAETSELSVEELEGAIDGEAMPSEDDGLVPVAEFYGE